MHKTVAISGLVALLSIAILDQAGNAAPVAGEDESVEWVKKDDLVGESSGTSENQVDEAKEIEKCPVCEKDFSYFRGFELECDHKFHEHCLNDWANERFREHGICGCPVCTRDIKFKTGQSLNEFIQERDRKFASQLREMWGVMAHFQYDIFREA